MSENPSDSSLMVTLLPAIIGLVGVLVGSLISVIRDGVASWFQRRRNARYAAIRLVSSLDEYAQKCVDVVSDGGIPVPFHPEHPHGEMVLEPEVDTPDVISYSDDIDWKCIEHKLMYRLLTLPNTARKVERHIAASYEHASPPGYEEIFDARHEGYAILGLEAMALAKELREAYDIDEPEKHLGNPDWDSKAFLVEQRQRFTDRREKDKKDDHPQQSDAQLKAHEGAT